MMVCTWDMDLRRDRTDGKPDEMEKLELRSVSVFLCS
jgi:hypothetical protein